MSRIRMVALIPARKGSKRVPRKCVRALNGVPLILYTVAAALASGVFERVYVCSDDPEVRALIDDDIQTGDSPIFWPRDESADDEPDISWVRPLIQKLDYWAQAFAILRPTSPFRTAHTIRRAFARFSALEAHSLRAVEPVTQHPGKMWQCFMGGYPMVPLIGRAWPSNTADGVPMMLGEHETPWHSRPTQTLPHVYIQNASLEMAWSYVIPAFGTISGRKIAPFFTEYPEGVDLNTEEDWTHAERIAQEHPEWLPTIAERAF